MLLTILVKRCKLTYERNQLTIRHDSDLQTGIKSLKPGSHITAARRTASPSFCDAINFPSRENSHRNVQQHI